jgi:hypothetical protein
MKVAVRRFNSSTFACMTSSRGSFLSDAIAVNPDGKFATAVERWRNRQQNDDRACIERSAVL